MLFCWVLLWSNQHATSLCGLHLAFSPGISLESKWCNHTVILTWLQLERIPILFYQRSDFHMVVNQSMLYLCLCWHHFHLMRYCYQGIWTGLLISEVYHLMRTWHHLDLNWALFYLCPCWDQCFLLPAPSYATETRLELLYLQDVLVI